MTKQDVITLLESKGAVMVTQGRVYEEKATSTEATPVHIHIIHFRTKEGDTQSPLKSLELIEVGGVIDYHGSKPDILKDAPTVTPPRDLYKTEDELKTIFATAFPTLTVINLDVRRKGNMDIATVDASDGTNILPEQKYGITRNGDGTFNYEKIA